MNKSDQYRYLMLALAAIGITGLILFGLLGFGRGGGEEFSDVRYWRTSTGLWLDGGNPYELVEFTRHAVSLGYDGIAQYAYPPTAFWMGLPLAGLTPVASGWIWTVLNLAALAGTIAGCLRLLTAIADRPATVAEGALIVAVMAGSPYTANVVWTGQTTLVVSCLLIWSWLFAYSGRVILAGTLLALASAKPQLVLLPALWLLLDRQWKVLFSAAAGAAVLSIVPLVTTGLETLKLWLQATTAYMNEPSPSLLLSHNLNLASVAKAFQWPGNANLGLIFMLAGAGFTILIYQRLRRTAHSHVIALGVLVPLSLLCFYGRDYDLAACGPLLALAMHVSRRSKFDLLVGLILVIGLNVPHRIAEKIDPVYLIYWRPVLLLFSVIWLVRWAYSLGNAPGPIPRHA